MNQRQKELLKILLVNKEVFQLKDLSERLDCSEKTVRNDLDRLEKELLEYPCTKIIRKPGFGVVVEVNDEDRTKLLQSLISNELKTNEERLFEIAYQLLTSHKPITLQFFAELYYVQKTAIKRDMETIAQWLERYDLKLLSKTRLGNIIEGLELNKRNALAHLSELNPVLANGKKIVLDLFLNYEITTVKKSLQEMQRTFKINYTDEAIESLLVHALIMVKRTRQRSPIFVREIEKDEASRRKEYEYVDFLFDSLESVFGLKFPVAEQVYFTWHLVSSKRMEEDAKQILHVDHEIAKLVQWLIDKMGKLTLIHFEDDPILSNGLSVHMHSVINRVKFGLPITNPLLMNIKKMYPYMFHMVMLTIEDMKELFAVDIPEDEAAYLVLHFQASIERLEKKRGQKKKALIVCHMGIGMSYLLEAKIEQQYQDIDILACIGKADLKDYLDKHPVNFIISTIPLEHVNKEYIVISPLFGQEDKQKLSKFVEELKHKHTESPRISAISTFLSKDLVFFNVKSANRYEVVEMLATALYEQGFVREEYIHSTVNREENSATAIGGGIAIPHGSQEMVQQTMLAIAIMDKPITWGHERVTIVFMLAVAKENHGEIRKIIGEISSLSEKPLVVHALTGARDFNEFVTFLDKNHS